MVKSIGIYGGSFDPIHFGHMNLAIEMLEKAGLNEVWFCPANVNPQKLDELPISAEDRLSMLLLGLEGMPGCLILNTEILRPAPSYTIDTIKELLAAEAKKPEGVQFFLILGEDSLEGFPKWKSVDEIVQLVPLLIGCRSYVEKIPTSDPLLRAAIDKGRVLTRRMDISSSEIRQRISQKRCCRHLLPQKVLDYIHRHELYLKLSL